MPVYGSALAYILLSNGSVKRVLFMISVIKSGIEAALNDLGVTSNNIANAKTTGFKKRQATFADIYGHTDAIKISGARIGMGSLTAENRVLNAQGTLQQTGDVLDLAIEGQGLFTLVDADRPDEKLYTRDGAFTVNHRWRFDRKQRWHAIDVGTCANHCAHDSKYSNQCEWH